MNEINFHYKGFVCIGVKMNATLLSDEFIENPIQCLH